MMPPPEEIARFVDRAETFVHWPPLSNWSSERRRRELARAVFRRLREDWDGAWTSEPVPVPSF